MNWRAMLNATFWLFVFLVLLYVGLSAFAAARGEAKIVDLLAPLGYAVSTLFGVLIGAARGVLDTKQ